MDSVRMPIKYHNSDIAFWFIFEMIDCTGYTLGLLQAVKLSDITLVRNTAVVQYLSVLISDISIW